MKDKTLDTKEIERPTWHKPTIMRIELKRTLGVQTSTGTIDGVSR